MYTDSAKPTGRETCGLCCMLGSNRNLMPRLECECQPPIPVDGHGVNDREPEPVIELGDGVAVLRQLEHEAADVLGLGVLTVTFPSGGLTLT